MKRDPLPMVYDSTGYHRESKPGYREHHGRRVQNPASIYGKPLTEWAQEIRNPARQEAKQHLRRRDMFRLNLQK